MSDRTEVLRKNIWWHTSCSSFQSESTTPQTTVLLKIVQHFSLNRNPQSESSVGVLSRIPQSLVKALIPQSKSLVNNILPILSILLLYGLPPIIFSITSPLVMFSINVPCSTLSPLVLSYPVFAQETVFFVAFLTMKLTKLDLVVTIFLPTLSICWPFCPVSVSDPVAIFLVLAQLQHKLITPQHSQDWAGWLDQHGCKLFTPLASTLCWLYLSHQDIN